MPPIREWDGASYDRVSGPMQALGEAVVERLPLRGEEIVLDAGCGSGRVTEALAARLPGGRVIGVDESASMIEAARGRLGELVEAGRVELRQGDLLELSLEEPVDAILSTATFHWIADHERLFGRLHAALRPGGRLIAQCGGSGNISRLRGTVAQLHGQAPYEEHLRDFRPPWNYATPEATEERLRRAGFAQARCWLQEAPAVPEHPGEFLSTIVLGPFVQALPEELRGRHIEDALELLGEPVVVDYVRLNIDAVA